MKAKVLQYHYTCSIRYTKSPSGRNERALDSNSKHMVT